MNAEILETIRTRQIDSASDPDQEYIYFMGSTRLVILIKNIYTLWGRRSTRLVMLIKNIYTLWGRKMASDPDQEYMYFMGSETRTIDSYKAKSDWNQACRFQRSRRSARLFRQSAKTVAPKCCMLELKY